MPRPAVRSEDRVWTHRERFWDFWSWTRRSPTTNRRWLPASVPGSATISRSHLLSRRSKTRSSRWCDGRRANRSIAPVGSSCLKMS